MDSFQLLEIEKGFCMPKICHGLALLQQVKN
jgi:hypothetical protein